MELMQDVYALHDSLRRGRTTEPFFRVLDGKTAECNSAELSATVGEALSPISKEGAAGATLLRTHFWCNTVDAFLHLGLIGTTLLDVVCCGDAPSLTVGWLASRLFQPPPPTYPSNLAAAAGVASYVYGRASSMRSLVTALSSTLCYVLPRSASPAFSIVASPSGPARVHCAVADGSADNVLRHWALAFDVEHGAPTSAYERFFDRIAQLISSPGVAAQVAARCCSVAKGLVFLWLSVHTDDPGGVNRHMVQAATALNVPLRRLETFAASLAAPPQSGGAAGRLMRHSSNADAFFSWAVGCWLSFVEAHVNGFTRTMDASSLWVLPGSSTPSQAHARSLVVTFCSATSPAALHVSASTTVANQEELHAMFAAAMSTSAADPMWGTLNTHHHGATIWALVHATRQHHTTSISPSSRVVLVDVSSSDPCVAWMFPRPSPRWATCILPRPFTTMAEAAGYAHVACIRASRQTSHVQLDEDEMSPFSLEGDEYFRGAMSCGHSLRLATSAANVIEYRQLSLPSKVTMLLIGLGVRFVGTSMNDGGSIATAAVPPQNSVPTAGDALELEATVDAHSSLVTILSPATLALLNTSALAAATYVLAPRIQAMARSYISSHLKTAGRNTRRLLRHVMVLQGFLRSLQSMRQTCHRDVFQRIARMQYLDPDDSLHQQINRSSSSLPDFFRTTRHGGSVSALRAAPRASTLWTPQLRHRMVALETLEQRSRYLLLEEQRNAWQANTSAVLIASPTWGVMYRQRIGRDDLQQAECAQFTQFVAMEESALRDRMWSIESRALSKVLAKAMLIRQEALAFAEEKHRRTVVDHYAEEAANMVESFNVIKQLNQLSELHTGHSLRQVLDREREYMEAPFQNRNLFHTSSLSSSHVVHPGTTLPSAFSALSSMISTSAADAALAEAVAAPSSSLTPHYARQRQRFLTSVLEHLGSVLTTERQQRQLLLAHEVIARCRSSEASERAALVKQQLFHLTKYYTHFQRAGMEHVERCHRLHTFQRFAELRDELQERCLLQLRELRLRLVLKQLMDHQAGLLRKSADDWAAVSSDRYKSPGVLLAELQREQRHVQHLLTSLHTADARQHAQQKDALRRSPAHSATRASLPNQLGTTVRKASPSAAPLLGVHRAPTPADQNISNGVSHHLQKQHSLASDRQNIRGTIH